MLRPRSWSKALAVLAASVALGLAGCGDGSDGGEEVEGPESTTTTIPIVSEVGGRRPWDGMILPPDVAGGYGDPATVAELAELADLGAPNVAVVVPLIQDQDSGMPRQDPDATPSDQALAHVMTAAAELELGVVLQVRVEQPTGAPATPPPPGGLGRWARDYGQLAVHYATLAERHGAALLVLDGPTGGTRGQGDGWAQLVEDVRAVYQGPVSLAVEAGQVDRVDLWDVVDVIGIDVDFPPEADVAEPVTADLEKAWEPVLAQLTTLAEGWSRPVVMTRVGFPGVDRVTTEPPGVEPDIQLNAYEALFTVTNQTPAIEGVLVWRWGDERTANGVEATFSPEDRPAEEVLRRAWTTPLADETETETETESESGSATGTGTGSGSRSTGGQGRRAARS